MINAVSEIWNVIVENREWLFSGLGIVLLGLFFSVFRQTDKASSKTSNSKEGNKAAQIETSSPYWHGITPDKSKYALTSEKQSSLPVSVQTFSFEFAPRGHAKPLSFQGKQASLTIQMDCRIVNPIKAIYEGGDYALNFLQPRFLTRAREVLEKKSLTTLRNNREIIATEILKNAEKEFLEHGVELQNVRIDSIEIIKN